VRRRSAAAKSVLHAGDAPRTIRALFARRMTEINKAVVVFAFIMRYVVLCRRSKRQGELKNEDRRFG
jgi:hypothetical protein